LADTTGSVYTIDAWTYPYTVPLLALWPTLAYGAWNETAANLPWLGVVLALGLGFYGQARLWGVAPLTALIFTWLLLSLPLLDTHVALAGYADLWLATVFGLAVIAFFQWVRDGDRRQGWLALLLALACPSIKLEGMVWLLLFLPALLAARLRGWWLLALVGVVLALGWVWWLTGGVEFNVPGLGEFRLTPELIQVPYLGRFALGYRGSWDPVMMNFLVLVNWHLLGYLMLLATGVAVVSVFKRGAARWQRAGLVFVVTSLLALFVLFFLTDAQRWAEQYTSINRVFLEFVPAFLFWVLTVFASRALCCPPRALGRGAGVDSRAGASTRRYNAATAAATGSMPNCSRNAAAPARPSVCRRSDRAGARIAPPPAPPRRPAEPADRDRPAASPNPRPSRECR
jgi:hypothetical protein